MDREQFQRAYGRIVAKAWPDEGFKQRLVSDPKTGLRDNGVKLPEGVEFKLVESADNLIYLVLLPRPDLREVSAEDLGDRRAASATCCTIG